MFRYLFACMLLLLPLEAIACVCIGPEGGKPISELSENTFIQITQAVDQRLVSKTATDRYPLGKNLEVVTTSRVLDPLGLRSTPFLVTRSGPPANSCSVNAVVGRVNAHVYREGSDGGFYTSGCSDFGDRDWLARYQLTGEDRFVPLRESCFNGNNPTGLEGCSFFAQKLHKDWEWKPEDLGFAATDIVARARKAFSATEKPKEIGDVPVPRPSTEEAFSAYRREDTEPRVLGVPILSRFDPVDGFGVWVLITNDYGDLRPTVMEADVNGGRWQIGVERVWMVREGRLVPSAEFTYSNLDPVLYEQVVGTAWPKGCSIDHFAMTDECEALADAFYEAHDALPSRELTPAALAAAYADLPSPPG